MKTNYCPVTIYVMFRFPKCGGDANTAVCRQNSVRQQIQAVNADAETGPCAINPGL